MGTMLRHNILVCKIAYLCVTSSDREGAIAEVNMLHIFCQQF
jgi:hypothetical protein